MISGKVTNRAATVEIELETKDRSGVHVEAEVDTGFNGSLTLPNNLIASLRFTFAGHRRATLADGRVATLDVYLGCVVWHGTSREVLVTETPGKPLIGMTLLEGCRLTMEVEEGGLLSIEAMPS